MHNYIIWKKFKLSLYLPYTCNHCQLLSTFCSIALFIFTNKHCIFYMQQHIINVSCVHIVVLSLITWIYLINQSSSWARAYGNSVYRSLAYPEVSCHFVVKVELQSMQCTRLSYPLSNPLMRILQGGLTMDMIKHVQHTHSAVPH